MITDGGKREAGRMGYHLLGFLRHVVLIRKIAWVTAVLFLWGGYWEISAKSAWAADKIDHVKVIIDTGRIGNDKYAKDFAGKLKNKLSKLYDDVVITAKPKEVPDQLVISLEGFNLSEGIVGQLDEASANTAVLIELSDSYREEYRLYGSGSADPSWGAEGLVHIALVFVFAIGFATGIISMIAHSVHAKMAARENAMDQIVDDLCAKIRESKDLQVAIHDLKMRQSLPSDLRIAVNFDDKGGFLPNKALDAGEDGEVTVTITNNGQGMGYGTILEIAVDDSDISVDKRLVVGDIQPGDQKTVRIPLKAGLDVGGGKVGLDFSLKEKRGYDARKVILPLVVAKLQKPQLVLVSTDINDGETGLAKGNGNGIIESGEMVELTAFIKNEGVGKALGANLKGAGMIEGVQWIRDSALVGTIAPGETAKAKLAFALSRGFSSQQVAAELKATDIRGVGNAQKRITYTCAQRSPNLQYAWKIFERGAAVQSIINGGEYDLELTLSNKGKMAARDVRVSLSVPTSLRLSQSQIDAGDLKEGASLSVQRIRLSVPRTFTESSVLLPVHISQSDFTPIQSVYAIPVAVKAPQLAYAAQLISSGGGNVLEQGETATLELRVKNEGSLAAQGVRVKIGSQDGNLRIIGKSEELLGTVTAGSTSETVKFQLTTSRRIKPGANRLSVEINQDDFPGTAIPYALAIREEGSTIIDVAAEDRVPVKVQAQENAGPAIIIKSPRNSENTSDEAIRFAFEVSDSRNVEMVRLTINGIRMDLLEGDGMTVSASKSKQIVKTIRLKEGENRILVTAYNVDNLLSSKETIVYRTGEEDVDTPVLTGMNNPDAVAVVIGVSKYERPEIPGVDYARRDAMKVKEYLIKTMGYKETNIIELYDEKATISKIKDSLNRGLKSMIKANSDVFIYFSGHGLPDANTKEPYLATYDMVPVNPIDTAYRMKDFYGNLETLKVRNVTIVLDACFSGMTDSASERELPLIRSASPAYIDVSNPLLKLRDAIVFTSSSAKQIASWYHAKQHGLFTYYFLQGLRGKADFDGSGVITAADMEKYLCAVVPQEAMKLYSREQMPDVFGNKALILVKLK
jgi:hypothetical protein